MLRWDQTEDLREANSQIRDLKGQCHEIFECWFFYRFPMTISNFAEYSRRYWNMKLTPEIYSLLFPHWEVNQKESIYKCFQHMKRMKFNSEVHQQSLFWGIVALRDVASLEDLKIRCMVYLTLVECGVNTYLHLLNLFWLILCISTVYHMCTTQSLIGSVRYTARLQLIN